MADHSRVKKFKLDCSVIFPDLSEEQSQTELFRESSDTTERTSSEDRQLTHQLNVVPDDTLVETPQPTTTHTQRIHAENLAWENSREGLLQAYYDTQIPRGDENCVECAESISTSDHFRCQDCSTHAYFCSEKCVNSVHQQQLLCFHKVELWKVCLLNNCCDICLRKLIGSSHSSVPFPLSCLSLYS